MRMTSLEKGSVQMLAVALAALKVHWRLPGRRPQAGQRFEHTLFCPVLVWSGAFI